MATKDKFIKAAGKLSDADDLKPSFKVGLPNLQSFGKATDDMDELYVKGAIAKKEYMGYADKREKLRKEYVKQYGDRRARIAKCKSLHVSSKVGERWHQTCDPGWLAV